WDREGARQTSAPSPGAGTETSAPPPAGTDAGRDAVATSTSPDSAGAHARRYSRPGARGKDRGPSAQAHRSWTRRKHGAAPSIPARYVGQAPSTLVLLQSPQQ